MRNEGLIVNNNIIWFIPAVVFSALCQSEFRWSGRGPIFVIIPTNVVFTVVDDYIQAENNEKKNELNLKYNKSINNFDLWSFEGWLAHTIYSPETDSRSRRRKTKSSAHKFDVLKILLTKGCDVFTWDLYNEATVRPVSFCVRCWVTHIVQTNT